MSSALLQILAGAIAALLAVFFGRRVLFLWASLRPRRPLPLLGDQLPTLLILVPARNEAAHLGRTLAALDRTDYPRDRLRIALVDDHSGDSTGELMADFAATRNHVVAVARAESSGKASALNAAISACPPSDLVAVCDADQAPRPDCWRRLALAFADLRVGAVAGYLLPANADASVISRYAAVETWVHQLVTSAGKDRLDLNPPMLGGGSVYRREALDQIGGFLERAYAEDLRATVSLTRAGWRTRFVPEAVVENLVPSRPSEYWHQHVRWARNVFDAGGRPRRRSSMPLLQRAEELVQATGYLDRVVLIAAVVVAAAGALPFWLPAGYLALAGVEAAAGILKGGAGRRSPWFLLATVACFPLDLAGAVVATVAQLSRRPLVWRSPRQRARTG